MSKFTPVFGNGFGCDFCQKEPCVGWVEVVLPNRSLGGNRGVEVFMVCAAHITLGNPVYPDHVSELNDMVATDSKGTVEQVKSAQNPPNNLTKGSV